MNQKIGRNDLCYCGSGKKYKRCHLAIDQAAEREQRVLKEAAQTLRDGLFEYAQSDLFAPDFGRALPIFWNELYDSTNVDEMAQGEMRIFCDWFAFDYELEDGSRVIETYRETQWDELNAQVQATLENWLTAGPFSGYELIAYEGQTLELREFMTGETYHVYEPAGRGAMVAGDIILAHVVPVMDHLEFSTEVPYIPAAEVADLAAVMAAAKEQFLADNPGADHDAFLRRNNYLLAKHALEEAVKVGRPPVARLDPARPDHLPPQTVRRYARR